jgi:hypothetical protein
VIAVVDHAHRRLIASLLCVPLGALVIAGSVASGLDRIPLVIWEISPYVVLAFAPYVFGRVWPSAFLWLATSALIAIVNVQTAESMRSTAALGYLIPPALATPLIAILAVAGVTRLLGTAVSSRRRPRATGNDRSGTLPPSIPRLS